MSIAQHSDVGGRRLACRGDFYWNFTAGGEFTLASMNSLHVAAIG
jgi:hypothetical protein